jgi:pyruvate-formate lyase-activating enzyme
MDKLSQFKHETIFVPSDTNNIEKIEDRIRSIEQNLAKNALSVLVVEATPKCNLSCNFCGMHSKFRLTKGTLKNHMDLDLFNETIRKCQDMEKLKVLYLHGRGEPLLNPNIVTMVDIAKNANIADQIILVTNGTLLEKKLFLELIEAGITSFRISLDIISPTKFREVKGADLGQKVLANIDACIDLIRTQHLTVSLIILCENPESQVKKLAKETKKILEYFAPKIKDLPNVVIQYRKLFNWVDSINRLTDGDEYQRKVPCEQPFYLLMICSDGDISMCCGDAMKKLVIGNICKVNSIKDLLTSDALTVVRKSLLEQNYEMIPACKCCEVYSDVDEILLERSEKLLKLLT